MNLRFLTLAVLGLAVLPLRAEDPPAAPAEFKNETEKFSYALGMNYGIMFNRQEIEVNLDALVKGAKDVLSSNKTLLTEEQMRQVLTDAQRRFTAKREEKRKAQAEENKKKAEVFLAENKNKPGVVTTDSGLQYKILTEGAGPLPGSNDTVTVNYRGTLLDGTEFDSSFKRNQPWTTSINRGIKGWTEALQKMKVGSKWQLFIPPNLAYGDNGGGPIPPGALLEFEVEMLTNTPPAAPPPVASPGAPLTSDIIKVPSLDEMKKGAKIETIKAEDVEKEIRKQQEKK